MENPLHAKYYADEAVHRISSVELCECIAHDTYLVRIHCPEIAASVRPGQFLMVRPASGTDPMLGRAFAMYEVHADSAGKPTSLDIVFHTVGKMTSYLAQVNEGSELALWGPLGNGFPTYDADHLIMVAGGIGQTPFLSLAKQQTGRQQYGEAVGGGCPKVSMCYGARSANYLAGIDDFRDAGIDLHIATDDGSAGEEGLVTVPLERLLDDASTGQKQVVCCGPEPMMEAVARLCEGKSVACQVSLETPMACGLGICFSCVAKVVQPDGSWDFKRTCVDGPVFDAETIVW